MTVTHAVQRTKPIPKNDCFGDGLYSCRRSLLFTENTNRKVYYIVYLYAILTK
jgi:hypothetical protein